MNKFFVASIIFVILYSDYLTAQDNDGFAPVADSDGVLKMIADHSKANFERIKTLNATYDYTDKQYFFGEDAKVYSKSYKIDLGEKFMKINKGKYKYALDVKKDSIFVELDQESWEFTTFDGKVLPVKNDSLVETFKLHQRSILTPESYMYCEPDVDFPPITAFEHVLNQPYGRVGYKETRENASRLTLSVVPDVRTCYEVGGMKIWEFCDFCSMYKNATAVYQKNDKYKITFDPTKENNDDSDATLTHIIVDASMGFNVVHTEQWFVYGKNTKKESELKSLTTVDYSSNDGIWIPSVLLQKKEPSDMSTYKFDRTYTAVSISVNSSLPKKTFSYVNLGLEDGDRFVDSYKNTLFTLRGGKLKDFTPNNVNTNSHSYSALRVFLIIAGLALITFAVVNKIRETRRSV